jgi:aconitate hydratase
MGVLPCQLKEPLALDGSEKFDILGLSDTLKPRQELTLVVNGVRRVTLLCRIDTQIEVEYYRHRGILPFVLRQLVAQA